MSDNAYFKSPYLFLAVETRTESLGEKWHRVCVLSASLETFGFCTLAVTLGCCQIYMTDEEQHG